MWPNVKQIHTARADEDADWRDQPEEFRARQIIREFIRIRQDTQSLAKEDLKK